MKKPNAIVICLVIFFSFFAFGQEKTNLVQEKDKKVEKPHLLIPLPFYGARTGFGLTIKYMYLKPTYTFDVLTFGTQKKQFALFSFFSYHLSNWDLKPYVQLMEFNREYFGVGNRLPLEKYDEFNRNSWKPGLDIWFKKFQPFQFQLGISYLDQIFEGMTYSGATEDERKGFHQREVMGKWGVQWERQNSDQSKNASLRYSHESSLDRKIDTWSVQAKKWFCFSSLWHYAGLLEFKRKRNKEISRDTIFSDIRGIRYNRVNDRDLFLFANEVHWFMAGQSWFPRSSLGDVFLVFIGDMGRVYQTINRTNFFEEWHHGYGLGIRYKIREQVFIRADYARSRGDEWSFVFNYNQRI